MTRWAKMWLWVPAVIATGWHPIPTHAEPQAGESEASNETTAAPEAANVIPRLAEIRLDEYVVPARLINLPLPGRTKTVREIMDRFDRWAKEDRIGAVMLEISNLTLSLPDIEELRQGIVRLQAADKKVLAFLNGATPQGYLLACGADEIAMPPTANVVIPGLGALFPFMKGHFQMLGIEFDVITAGRYKYPGFINLREPNEFFEEEYNAILDSWIEDYYDMIAATRELDRDAVKEAVNIALLTGDEALQRGLVDSLAYRDDYRDQVLRREKMKRYGRGEDGLARVKSIQDLVELINETIREAEEARKAVGPKIAVLHARGPIIDVNLGASFASIVISRDDFSRVVDELKRNKSIKAVVMRVDSPGGSGYASDVIWHKLRELGDEKPLVVSMGVVAGSGGYYIASPARRIFAQPTTITGSIGVLGIFQSARSQFNRMDYEMATMQRGDRALLGAPHRALAEQDRAFVQDFIDSFYDVFIDRVAVTRKIPASQVRKIAEGRIYTGRQALEVGLVDELGGLQAAIDAARRLANIPPSAELKIVHYPRPSSLGEMFESFSAVSVTQALEMLAGSTAPAPVMPFDRQLHLLSQSWPGPIQPLCWMAVPEFYRPPAGPIQQLRDSWRRPPGAQYPAPPMPPRWPQR